MRANLVIKKKSLIFISFCLSSYIVFLLSGLYFKPVPLANLLGCLALIFYMATLAPSIFRTVFPSMRSHKLLVWLLKNRRHIGIISYVLASNHGLMIIVNRNISFLVPDTYFHYFQGIFIFFIMTILAITSNDWSIKKLKKNWTKLHQLTYIILLILPWHILDKMSSKWSYLTPLGIIINFVFIYFFIKRKRMENKPSMGIN